MMSRKGKYRIRNWSDYNSALIQRGSITLWFSQDVLEGWYQSEKSGQKGRPKKYSDACIECALTIRYIYKLPLRATQGFIESLSSLLSLPINSPSYSTLSRRHDSLQIEQPKLRTNNGPVHMVVDASGFRVYGEGEWKIRQHGKEKRRTWRKLHIGVDESSKDIISTLVTESSVHDSEALPHLVNNTPLNLSQVTGDGAYDSHLCYATCIEREANPCFPPRVNASRHKPIDKAWITRNHAVSHVMYKGLKNWKLKNNYHRRSLSENAFFRLKKIFGSDVKSQCFKSQAVELGIKCKIINKFNRIGMPDSFKK